MKSLSLLWCGISDVRHQTCFRIKRGIGLTCALQGVSVALQPYFCSLLLNFFSVSFILVLNVLTWHYLRKYIAGWQNAVLIIFFYCHFQVIVKSLFLLIFWQSTLSYIKRTSSLEAYIEWFNRLSYLVATEICLVSRQKNSDYMYMEGSARS